MPDSVEYIGYSSLPNGLENLEYHGKSLKFVGSVYGRYENVVGATRWAQSQTGLVTLGNVVVGYNGEETEVNIPDSVDVIGACAFVGEGAARIQTLNLGKHTTAILEYGLMNCSDISSINIPRTVSEVAYCAFVRCFKLEDIILEDGITDMPGEAGNYKGFENVRLGGDIDLERKLHEVHIPKSMISMDWYDGLYTTIACYKNSFAHQYAKENKISFVLLDDAPEPHVHKYTEEIEREATCSQTGIKKLVCQECGDTKTETIPKTGHTPVIDEAVEATDTTPGKTEGSHCAVCGEILVAQQVIPAGGSGQNACRHANTEIKYAREAGCINSGDTGCVFCKDCKALLSVGRIINPLGHRWDNGRISRMPSGSSPGIRFYLCEVCGAVKQESYQGLPAGTVVNDKAASYKFLKNGTLEYRKPLKKSVKTVAIPGQVTVNGYAYKVTAIGAKAFSNCKKLAKATISGNIETIGKRAFSGCKKLRNITITGKNIKSAGSGAFSNIHKKASFRVPGSKKKAYRKLFMKRGLSSRAKFSSL